MAMSKQSVLLSILIPLLLGACADGKPCDPGYDLRSNICFPKEASSEGGAGGALGTMPEPPSEEFGLTCGEDTDCGGDAPSCAKAPGAEEGICSVLGCDSAPAEVLCPIGWSCFSIGDVCLED
jgi:hypothetical protein